MADLRNQEMTLVTPAVNSAEREGRRLPSWLLSSLIHLGLLLGLALLQLTIFSEREDPCSFTALSPDESLDGLMVELPDGEFSAYSLAVEAENSNFIDDDVADAADLALDGVEGAEGVEGVAGADGVAGVDAAGIADSGTAGGFDTETGIAESEPGMSDSESGATAETAVCVFSAAEPNWFRFQVTPVPTEVVSEIWSTAFGADLVGAVDSVVDSAADAVAARVEGSSDETQVTAPCGLLASGSFAGPVEAGVTGASVFDVAARNARFGAEESFFLRHYGGEPWG